MTQSHRKEYDNRPALGGVAVAMLTLLKLWFNLYYSYFRHARGCANGPLAHRGLSNTMFLISLDVISWRPCAALLVAFNVQIQLQM